MEKLREKSEAEIPTVDLSLLRDALTKSSVIQQIGEACQTHGCFHVINHGVRSSVIEAALDVNSRFFDLPIEEKEQLSSDDVFKEVRFVHMNVRGFSRDFLKMCSNPLDRYLRSWPTLPQDYCEIMGTYATEVRKIAIELFRAIMESLNLGEAYLRQNFEQGEQILGINRYKDNNTEECLGGSNSISGLPPHTDHSIITVLLQSSPGFQLMGRGGDDSSSWRNVVGPVGSFQVLVGDHLEVLSNGLYKSVLHRAVSNGGTRLSVANLHSLSRDEDVEPAKELLSEVSPRRYVGSSLSDFLRHLASGDARAFLDTVKI